MRAGKYSKERNIFKVFRRVDKNTSKENVDIVFSITNVADIIDTPIAETVLSNIETRIFYPGRNAENEIQRENYKNWGSILMK